MKTKIILVVFLVVGFLASTNIQAQESSSELSSPKIPTPTISKPVQIEGSVDCFDYYKFGSVQVNVESEIASTVSGVPMSFVITIKNENNYPIVEGAVYAKVFKKQNNKDNTQSNGNLLVDQFFIKDDISLDAGGQRIINFDWKVPSYALSGEYQIAMFFTSAKKFNLLGLSFTDDVVGNTVNFAVTGEIEKNIEFDKNAVYINGANYHFAAFPPRFKDEDIQVETDLVNFTGESQIVPVIYKLYSWDGQTEENLIETKNETIQIDSNETKQLAYTITDKSSPVYYLVVEADWQDSKSILDIRTVRENVNKVRINFPSITSYPLKQNEKNTLFVCAHNSGTANMVENNKLVISILDENQEEIHQYAYEGPISGAMMGLKDEFIPKENHSTFYIKSELYTDGQLVDSARMKYDCRDIDPMFCSASSSLESLGVLRKGSNTKELILLIAIILTILAILGIVGYVMVKNKKSGINLFLIFGFIMLAVVFGEMPKAEAKSVVWSDILKFTGHRTYVGLYTSNVSVALNATLQNAVTGVALTDGSFVSVGTKINIIVNHSNTDISWFGTGYNLDSPYGYWKNLASRPVGASCVNLVNWIGDGDEYYYADLSVNPPTITLSNSGAASLSCSGMVCAVNSPGTIKLNVNFSNTYGKWHWSWIPGYYQEPMPKICTILDPDLGYATLSSPNVVVPSQVISYNLTAVSSNNPPAIPVITGPIAGIVDTNYNFTIVAADPDGDRLLYGVDWDNNNIIDQWMPGAGFVNSGVSQAATRQWPTTGTKTFKVNACDSNGSCSGFASHTITLSSVPVFSCTGVAPANATLVSGDDFNLTASTIRKVVAFDTVDKCEYMCNSPYTFDGVSSCDCAVSCAACSADCDGGIQICTDCHGSTISVSCNTRACPIEGIDNNWREVSP